MSFERNPAASAEHAQAPMPPAAGPSSAGPTPVALRMQILTTEHWSLLASRGLAWNESFTRAGMFLSTLSGAMVALGLIAGVDRTGDVFFVFALVILPVVLFVGVATLIRMGSANYHDALTVIGMNRIRAAYLEQAPDLEPYFVMGVHDDPPGIGLTMATPPGMRTILHVISATPFLVSMLNAVLAGAIIALAAYRFLGLDFVPTLAVAAVVFLATVVVQMRFARGSIQRGQRSVRPMFPTPGGPWAAGPATGRPGGDHPPSA
jgi:hypothetical protein